MTELWNYENRCWEAGYETVCGVDEAGRGPLAGPVCAAAVILPRGLDIPGLNDSKKLTAKRREALYDIITEQALAYGIAFASEQEIDGSTSCRRRSSRCVAPWTSSGCGRISP